MTKTALITGISGQDGSYLAKLLLSQGYMVHGITRDESDTLWRHEYLKINGACHLHAIDLTDEVAVQALVDDIKPTEIYHLAAQSSVSASIKDPIPTLRFNTLSTFYLLQACAKVNTAIKFFHASSSDIFDPSLTAPLSQSSPLGPCTPYGTSKATAHLLTQSFRNNSNLFAVNGILFPHESPLRHPGAFTKSLIRQAIAIKHGDTKPIVLGQILNGRDFGSAKEYVEAMWKSLQVDSPRDYIIGTGIPTTIKDIADYVVDSIGIPKTMITSRDNQTEEKITKIYAHTSQTEQTLNWKASVTIYEILDEMIRFELEQNMLE